MDGETFLFEGVPFVGLVFRLRVLAFGGGQRRGGIF
jgi:hypothetical protein